MQHSRQYNSVTAIETIKPTNCRGCAAPVGAGSPAKQATRWMAPALPVFAAKAAPTRAVPNSRHAQRL
ncbi:hypothetical protein CMV24_07485 [Pseudomonas plecoglossicida]|uniref:Uncharacterized protein n=1 Tax=Pseudomonas plecoglossicida TaxID=70775 RepID=A0A2A3M930_PSEDL|nr:hypothetical protein CMV24_07485 [Pseudomonas plecoglossicida]